MPVADLRRGTNQIIIQNMTNTKKSYEEELIILRKEFLLQKEELLSELIIVREGLAFQNNEKDKRAKELAVANKKNNKLEELLHNNFKEISDYKYALDESSIIAITDQKGIIKKVNNNFCLISKYREEELIGQDHRIINSGYHAKEFICNLWLTISNGKIWRGELKNKAKDGAFYWVDTTIIPFLDDLGKPYQYLSLRADITTRKETEEYLIQRTSQLETANKKLVFQHEEKEKRSVELVIANNEKEKRAAELIIANKELAFQNDEKEKRGDELNKLNQQLKTKERQLSNQLNAIAKSNATIEFDLNGNILAVNDNFLNIMGYTENEVLGKHHNIFVDEEYAKTKEYHQFWESLKKGEYKNDEYKRLHKNREIIWLLGSYNPILDISGKPFKVLKIATDVTLVKKQILELAQQSEEKEKWAAELRIANKKIAYENNEREKRADELIIANKELAFQNNEKEKRSAELGVANKEKGKRSAELIIANKELVFQNEEKEKRAAELIIANKELAFQNDEKEKRAEELTIANKELAFQNDEKEKRAAELTIANKELAFQNDEKGKRAEELTIANKELAFQNDEKEKRAAELGIANKELAFQNDEKEKRAAELNIANIELAFQNEEKEKRATELTIANTELAFQNDEKEKRAEELGIANKELAFQNEEKEKRAAELNIANIELAFQNEEKEKRATELTIANTELAFQNEEKEKRAAELSIANTELAFQNEEKEKRAAELTIANKELAFQNDEKGKRAEELTIANNELAFQNDEKEKRAAELIIANKELAFQNQEKEKRAAELIIANKELAFQNDEKEKRAEELIIANKELAFQNDEKEKRAAELIIANKELAFQNEEKEKRAAELIIANKELLAFTYISSHDLQEPLRKIQIFSGMILEEESENLSDKGKHNFQRMRLTAERMQQLIQDLLAFSRISTTELEFEKKDLNIIIEDVVNELKDTIQEKNATIEAELCTANIIPFQFRQLMYNLISNALKFSNSEIPSHIIIKGEIVKGSGSNNEKLSRKKNYCHITIKDNGIGFEPHFNERIFGVFQKLHSKEEYGGTGIGLAIVKKIVENHNGIITAEGELMKGATFDIYIPAT